MPVRALTPLLSAYVGAGLAGILLIAAGCDRAVAPGDGGAPTPLTVEELPSPALAGSWQSPGCLRPETASS